MLAQSKATAALIVALSALLVNAAVPLYGQCGGLNYSGETTCVSGACCQYQNDWYSQCLSCSSGGTTTTTTTKTTATTTTSSTTASTSTASGLRSLNLLAKAHNRYFGTAVDGIWSSTDTTWLNLANNFNEFGMITPGNAMKMDSTEPSRNSFNYAHADYTVTWAHAHKQVIRGHTLVWHSQVPSWVSNGGFNNATLISIMQNHITNEVTHFKGQVYAWDVVNECFNDDGTWRTNSIWYSTIGSSFVPIALRAAAAADPSAKLYINDYNIDGLGSKSDAHYNNAKSLLAQGVPLHGIGSQGHLIVNSIPTTIPSNIARFVALGLEFAFTELDIRMPTPATSSNLAIQASDYATVVSACTGSAGCVGVTTWDVSDDHSWIPGTFPGYGAALLFDSNKQPKPAYTSVANVLASATVNSHFTSWI